MLIDVNTDILLVFSESWQNKSMKNIGQISQKYNSLDKVVQNLQGLVEFVLICNISSSWRDWIIFMSTKYSAFMFLFWKDNILTKLFPGLMKMTSCRV